MILKILKADFVMFVQRRGRPYSAYYFDLFFSFCGSENLRRSAFYTVNTKCFPLSVFSDDVFFSICSLNAAIDFAMILCAVFH